MELLIGLLIGITWGAGFSSFVHWAHEREKVERAEKLDRIAKGQDKPEPWPLVPSHEESEWRPYNGGTPGSGLKQDEIPPSCTCDWVSERALYKRPEDERFALGMRDPHCPYHSNGF
ncbi:membrane protein [Arthrobacter phage Thunderclap]|uniref:Uncharacterized protein n=6 Tax=Amigovirus amigo TaxID=1982100 RepID=A0A5J6TBS7_9CAUD|nr:hypothetical protein FDH66_gp56 [Arthrobacter phage Amigo]QFG08341.1 hypothetical protein SEA_YEEZUS_46 [Arthrobacter phage Yeezus]QFG13389.1 hypothetical protein SEA_ICHOR_46 [Arthrobacter phage Ichor]QFG13907.1 hypothetical protein SEA_JAEK_46 [Arthrobacter phage Jaek]QJD51694.1 hypothetical protein SEA_BOERSMA_48 [Arthrobacter phage Boersma]QOR56102.1 membrane protein [Arthrobacter phage Thunderclap]